MHHAVCIVLLALKKQSRRATSSTTVSVATCIGHSALVYVLCPFRFFCDGEIRSFYGIGHSHTVALCMFMLCIIIQGRPRLFATVSICFTRMFSSCIDCLLFTQHLHSLFTNSLVDSSFSVARWFLSSVCCCSLTSWSGYCISFTLLNQVNGLFNVWLSW